MPKTRIRTLKDLEKSTKASKITVAARKFYLDKWNPWNQRLAAFNKYAKEEPYILSEEDIKDPILQRIYKDWEEYGSDIWNKYETIPLESVIEWWIDELIENRIDMYDMEKSKRNYKPSKKALEKIKDIYMKRILKTGIKSFRYDW